MSEKPLFRVLTLMKTQKVLRRTETDDGRRGEFGGRNGLRPPENKV